MPIPSVAIGRPQPTALPVALSAQVPAVALSAQSPAISFRSQVLAVALSAQSPTVSFRSQSPAVSFRSQVLAIAFRSQSASEPRPSGSGSHTATGPVRTDGTIRGAQAAHTLPITAPKGLVRTATVRERAAATTTRSAQ